MVNPKVLIVLVLTSVISFVAGSWMGYGRSLRKQSTELLAMQTVRQKMNYQFINPLLECEASENTLRARILPFKDEIQEEVDTFRAGKPDLHISVYFRDLNNGLWFGIDEKEDFSPASLLKVPVMMAYFKAAEDNPDFLQTTIRHASPPAELYSQSIAPAVDLVAGEQYTYEQLLTYAIVHSSNAAAWELTEHLDISHLETVYRDLGVNFRTDEELKTRMLTVGGYASFFRILFNASYLSREYSEKALQLLTQTEFKDGIVAGVPAEIKVAHKFGERTQTATGLRQLHDCGIVYYPNHPYLLCIMTKGESFDYLGTVIAGISRRVFEEIQKQAQIQPPRQPILSALQSVTGIHPY